MEKPLGMDTTGTVGALSKTQGSVGVRNIQGGTEGFRADQRPPWQGVLSPRG